MRVGVEVWGTAAILTSMLILAATPIGDIDDVSPRLRRTIEEADVVAAEDTRRFRALCERLGVTPRGRVVSYFEGNEAERTPDLVADVAEGRTVVVVTDAGMPSVSDPGYRLVTAAVAEGLPVTAVPGPSAVLTALAVSGLAVDRFCFEGFLPRKPGPRRTRLDALAQEERTMVFFEAPHRLADFLTDAAAAFGARQAAVCRELTKTYEEVVRGTLAELADWAVEGARGEITIVVSGHEPVADLDAAVSAVHELMAAGEKRKPAVKRVAADSGVSANELYEASLER